MREALDRYFQARNAQAEQRMRLFRRPGTWSAPTSARAASCTSASTWRLVPHDRARLPAGRQGQADGAGRALPARRGRLMVALAGERVEVAGVGRRRPTTTSRAAGGLRPPLRRSLARRRRAPGRRRRGRARRGRRRRSGGAAGLPGLARPGPKAGTSRSWPWPRRSAARGRHRRGRGPRQRSSLRGHARARDPPRRPQHRVLRRARPTSEPDEDVPARQRLGDQPRALRALRRGGADHALERAVHALDLEGRPGPRGGLHGRAQAAGVGAAHLLAAGRPGRRRRPSGRRAERRAGHRRGGRRRAGRAPRRRPHHLHRLGADRRARSCARPPRTSRRCRSSSAASRRSWSSPTPTSTRRSRTRWASTTTPGRCASRARACWSSGRCSTRSSRGS